LRCYMKVRNVREASIRALPQRNDRLRRQGLQCAHRRGARGWVKHTVQKRVTFQSLPKEVQE